MLLSALVNVAAFVLATTAAVAYALLTWESFSEARNTDYGWIWSPAQAVTIFAFVFYNCGYYFAEWAGLGNAGQKYLGELRKYRLAGNLGLAAVFLIAYLMAR